MSENPYFIPVPTKLAVTGKPRLSGIPAEGLLVAFRRDGDDLIPRVLLHNGDLVSPPEWNIESVDWR